MINWVSRKQIYQEGAKTIDSEALQKALDEPCTYTLGFSDIKEGKQRKFPEKPTGNPAAQARANEFTFWKE